jgi:hypothetical protein
VCQAQDITTIQQAQQQVNWHQHQFGSQNSLAISGPAATSMFSRHACEAWQLRAFITDGPSVNLHHAALAVRLKLLHTSLCQTGRAAATL